MRVVAAVLVAVVAALGLTQVGAGAVDIAVEVRDNSYAPADLTITVGDSVTWTVTGNNQHTVTSSATPPAWPSSPQMNDGDSFTVDFNAPGDFAYFCEIHGQSMAGVVRVQTNEPTTASTAATTSSTTSSSTTSTTAASTTSSSDTTTSSSTSTTVEDEDEDETTTTTSDEEAAAEGDDDDDLPGWLLLAVGLVVLAIATIGGLLARSRNRDGMPPEPPPTAPFNPY
jgi:plastocyanin